MEKETLNVLHDGITGVTQHLASIGGLVASTMEKETLNVLHDGITGVT